MIITNECAVVTNSQKRQLREFGSPQFPIQCSDVNLDEMEVPWHWHDEMELEFIASGNAQVSIGGSSYILHEGQGVFINAGVLHSFSHTETQNCHINAMVFHPRLIGGSMESVFWQKYLQPLADDLSLPFLFFTCDDACQRQAIAYIRHVWQSCVGEQPGYEFEVRDALSRLIFLIMQHRPDAQPKIPSGKALRDAERMKRMLRYIQEHYSEQLSTAKIAQSAAISESECLRCFRSVIGMPPIQYVNQFRIQNAAELLVSTNQKIADIGALCGFQETSYFTKTFRKLKGCTPSEYRQQHQQ